MKRIIKLIVMIALVVFTAMIASECSEPDGGS
jgi:hypothetical protein